MLLRSASCSLLVITILMSPLAAADPQPAGDPLFGDWVLNRERSHYGPGAEPREKEHFRCRWMKQRLRCSIESVRAGGRSLTGTFTAAYDGKSYVSSGIPGVDAVSLTRVDDFVADATFSYKGRPVFGYRAVKSDDGRHLTMVSTDPVTRSMLHSVIAYDRQ